MKELMNNPYAWTFLSLCTIASLIFAIYTWVVGRKIKEISIDYYGNNIIKRGKKPISKLDIKFDGKQIQDLSSSIFYIWNSGNDIINGEDIVTTKLLRIRCNLDNILDAKIIKQSDDSNEFSILEFSPTDVKISFKYMDSGEGIVIQVLHTGSEKELFFDCKIKGGKPIRDCSELRKEKGVHGFLRTCIDDLTPISICIFFVCFILTKLKLIILFYIDHPIIVVFITVLFLLSIISLCEKMQKKIRNSFRRDIPDILKS